jgi:hypothetical protein
MYFTLFIKKASKLLAQFDEGSVLGFVDGDDIGYADEVECILYLTCEAAESEFPSAIFTPLSRISDISDRFTIEVVEFSEVEESARLIEISDISDDIRKSRVDISLIEFSME